MTLKPASRRQTCTPAWVSAVVCLLLALGGVNSHAQGRGPGGGGGMMGGGGNSGGGRMGMGFDRGSSASMGRSNVRSGPQLGLTGRWWDDSSASKKIGLRTDQQHRMDDIFESNKPQLINLLGNLQREEAHLMALPPGELQDETKVFAAIDRVSQARAELEKANARTLMQIRQQMDTTQLAALDREIANTR